MRLLNVHDLRIREFNDTNRPPYAILSHTWEVDEVSYQSIHTPTAVSMAGYVKILKCCEIAKQDGFEYVWIDTCCIDKTSSAELSEAINSMFMWYRSASVCYVFLADLHSGHDHYSQFRKSRWFTRGWTLQELLAPETVVFYSCDWVDIGTKRSLQDIISDITKIPRAALLDAHLIQNSCVAARMSWSGSRNTTRVEDRAYSLMGLFGVNMPLLYGEGHMAFRRLQLEIMKDSSDESIFAWSDGPPQFFAPGAYIGYGRVNMLAPTPAHFEHLKGAILDDRYQSRPPFVMSNKGLHIWLPCKHFAGNHHVAALNCKLGQAGRVCIIVEMQPATGECARVTSDLYTVGDAYWNTVDAPTELYIKQIYDIVRPESTGTPRHHMKLRSTFHFTENMCPKTGYHLDYMFDGMTASGFDKPPNRTGVFDEIHLAGNPGIMCLVVKSIQDPNIQALIVLGRIHKSGSRITYQYRVFSGSRMPSILERFTRSTGEWVHSLNEIFPGDGSQYYPNDKIIKRLHANHIITIVIRKGPLKASIDGYYCVYDQHYQVQIAFSRPSFRDKKISDADTVSYDDGELIKH